MIPRSFPMRSRVTNSQSIPQLQYYWIDSAGQVTLPGSPSKNVLGFHKRSEERTSQLSTWEFWPQSPINIVPLRRQAGDADSFQVIWEKAANQGFVEEGFFQDRLHNYTDLLYTFEQDRGSRPKSKQFISDSFFFPPLPRGLKGVCW